MDGEEVLHRGGNVEHVRLRRKVSSVEELNRRVRKVLPERLCARRNEEGIVLAPDGQEGRLRSTKVLVKCRIQLHIGGVVEEQIQLDLLVPWALQQSRIQRIGFGCHGLRVGYAVRVLPPGAFRRQNGVAEYFSILGGGRGPVGPDR